MPSSKTKANVILNLARRRELEEKKAALETRIINCDPNSASLPLLRADYRAVNEELSLFYDDIPSERVGDGDR